MPVAGPLIDGAAGDAANGGRIPPLVVDVDGSLVSGDLLIEGVARMLAASPLKLLALPLWLAGGRAACKRRVARAAALPPETLALNRAVLDEIASARSQGREVWLASAADETVVAPLAERVGAAGLCILLYLAGSSAYSLWLKRLLYADVLALALLYVMRILAGAVPVAIVPSGWLLGFSLFIFLALAIVKRQTGLAADDSDRSPASGGRAYHAGDLPAMTALGAASGIAAVVVLALYIQSPEVSARYARPELLWLMAPLLLWWLGRMTLLAHRGSVDADPVVFAMRDGVSRLAGLGILVLFIAAS